jgi:hypothetical protein
MGLQMRPVTKQQIKDIQNGPGKCSSLAHVQVTGAMKNFSQKKKKAVKKKKEKNMH